MPGFFKELKRRNVVRAGIAYILLAWLALQIAEVFLPVPETDRLKEIESLQKERSATMAYIKREEGKLRNENFIYRAPPKVVKDTQQRVEQAAKKLEAIDRKMADLGVE